MRKISFFSILAVLFFSATVLVSSPEAADKKVTKTEKNETVKKDAAKEEPAPVDTVKAAADEIKKLSSITGLTMTQLTKMKLDTDTVLRVYSAASASGNPFMTVLQNSDDGKDLGKFYKKYYVSDAAQGAANEKFAKHKEEFNKTTFTKDSYEGINKLAVAELLSSKLGASKSGVLEYGFGSGVPMGDILLCSAFVNKTGNSLSTVLEKRKQLGSMDAVYKNFAIRTEVIAEISGLANQYSEEMNSVAKTAAKPGKVEINDDMKDQAKKLAAAGSTSKDRILEEMKNGHSADDIKKAMAISRKVGGDFTAVLRLKLQGGWTRVKTYYSINDSMQQEINKEETDLNNRLTPPPQPADVKKE